MVENITIPKNALDIYIDTLLEMSRTQRRCEERIKAQQVGELFDSERIPLPEAA